MSLDMPKMSHITPHLIEYGDSAILVQYELAKGELYNPQINHLVHSLAHQLRASQDWLEVVPGYDSLLCQFNLYKTSFDTAKDRLNSAINALEIKDRKPSKVIDIPVCYGAEFGPDMDAIKARHQRSEKDIIQEHSNELYDVCMMGFIPGFTFLSEAPKALHHPRHATPRSRVPAGSVGIADWQTGIYGLESPGGWQIIGRTPLKLFDPARKSPFLVQAGDQIRFTPIDAKTFHEIQND